MNKLFFIILLLILFSCNNSSKNIAQIKVDEMEYDFGKIKIGDTVSKVFKVQNVSDTPLIIHDIGTSCGCTGAILSDSVINRNQYAEIAVSYIPKKGDAGNIKNSVVLEANTEPSFITLYLNGVVIDD